MKEVSSIKDLLLMPINYAARSKAAKNDGAQRAPEHDRARPLQLPPGYLQHYGIQRRSEHQSSGTPAQLTALAHSGMQGAASEYPHREKIEASFGQPIQAKAYTDEGASAACDAMNAHAYALGAQVAFAGRTPDLHTAAHEAAHTLQQARGVQLKDGIGERGDRYEREADHAADLVVSGASAAHLFSSPASPATTAPVVQRDERRDERRGDRTRREEDRDRRERRPEGGRDRARALLGDFESDWAGRAILERYLFGEGDWDIWEDAQWKHYMMASRRLRRQVRARLIQIARRYQSGPWQHGVPIEFSETFAAEVENGEGIIGYQYLHGTNADVGGFRMWGTVTIEQPFGHSNADGTTTAEPGQALRMAINYRWNDMIDPNPQYQTDSIKSLFAELITLGQAESYRISIGWQSPCEVQISAGGNIEILGYPGP